MHESVLRDYFLGRVNDSRLNADLTGSVVQTSYDVTTHYVNPMEDNFQLERSHLVKLCDAVQAGHLDPKHLEIIGHCLVASEHFFFPEDSSVGDVARETAYDWASPEINFPLTLTNVAKCRDRLLTGKEPFTRADAVG